MASLSGVQLNLVDSFDQAAQFMRWLGERRPSDTICVDTETSGLDPYALDAKIRLIQFGDGMNGWAIPWELWSGLAIEALQKWEGDFVGHNLASFDLRWIEEHSPFRFPQHRTRDTMIAAHIIDPLGPGGLKPLSRKIVDNRAMSGEKRLHDAMVDNKWTWATVPWNFGPYWQYGALDTVLGYRIDETFSKQVGDGGRFADIFDLEMAARFVVTRMEQRGSRIDLAYCQHMGQRLYDHAEQIKQWGKDNFGILLSSGKQLAKWFTDQGETITVFSEKTGAPSVDKWQLQIFSNSSNPTVAMVADQTLLMRKNSKIASTYFANLVETARPHLDGDLVHANIRTLGARTSRMSVSDPPLQQLPKSSALVRRAFIPREGRKIIATDYSQIEMRLLAHFSEDPGLVEAFLHADANDGDFFVEMGKQIYNESGFQKSDKRRGLVKNCVPLDSKILTRRGWLSYDEVKVGDETLGYNLETGRSEWTEVLEVVVFNDPDDLTPLYRYSNGQRELVCTDNHRWVVDNGRSGPRASKPRFAQAKEIPGTEKRVILAAQAEDGDLPITPDEAALLGWTLGDGGIKRVAPNGSTAQGAGGWRAKCEVNISQTKPDEILIIERLMDQVGVQRRLCLNKKTGQHVWYLNPDYCRDLLGRAGIEDKRNFDPWTLALGLTHESRVALADALSAADGKAHSRGLFHVVQEAGTPVAELCRALGFVLGKFARTYKVEPDGKGWQRKPIETVQHQKPYLTGQRMTSEYVGDAAVWCVRTELETWTMRQGDIAYCTGNTMYGLAYGAGVKKMAESAGVLETQMKPVVDSVHRSFPGIKRFQKTTIDLGNMRERTEGQGYVVTPFGRRVPCDDGKAYALVNYALQSHAAEVFKRALVDLDSAGFGEYMILPVHDEIVMDMPDDLVVQALREVPHVMAATSDYKVPLYADSEGGFENWGEKYI